jgi:plastocyanin
MRVLLPIAAMTVLTFGCGSADAPTAAPSSAAPATSSAALAPTTTSTTLTTSTVSPTPTATATLAPTGSPNAQVDITDFAFNPADVRVNVGGAVTWTNNDDQQHTATGAGAFDAEAIKPGESATVTFETAGSFPYICSFHPFMAGTITVGSLP